MEQEKSKAEIKEDDETIALRRGKSGHHRAT